MQCKGYDLEEGAESAVAEEGAVPEDSRIEKLEFELGVQHAARHTCHDLRTFYNPVFPGAVTAG